MPCLDALGRGEKSLLLANVHAIKAATYFDQQGFLTGQRSIGNRAGYVWTRGELIRTALGSDFEGIDRTVDSHMHNLRRKVEDDPKIPIYILTVYGVGYSLGSPEDNK